ncbi:MAG: hypothetical protein M3136_12480 [Thermoproteota archaeon]|jgi:hypothetical protein|nr:hypothetical protein [Thermoproteota archaeon]
MAPTPALAGYPPGAPYSIGKAWVIALIKHIPPQYCYRNIQADLLALGNTSTQATLAL